MNNDIERESNFLDSKKYHIVGDSAFALKSWLLVPYKRTANGLTPSQKLFNRKLSVTRVCVEMAFGDLQNRFRRMQNIDAKGEKCVYITVTACILHNMCISNGDLPHRETVIDDVEEDDQNHSQTVQNPIASAIRKREAVRSILERQQRRN